MLHGMTRVRGFTQDDAHLFCTPEQLQGEFEQTARRSAPLDSGLRLRRVRVLSLDPRPSADRPTGIAEEAIRKALESRGLPFQIDEGGGAFYGPKLDFNVRDAIGRPWQLGTVQVDFDLPERFELNIAAATAPTIGPS